MDSITLAFVTGNRNKFEEVRRIFDAEGVRVEQVDAKGVEIQSDSLKDIASNAAVESAKHLRRPVLIEDAGFCVHQLNGFPGPYSSYVLKTLGCAGILNLMKDAAERTAEFRSALAYCELHGRCEVFEGMVHGKVSHAVMAGRMFGFDPIFIPSEGDGRAFSQMEIEEKNKLSHRGQSAKKFLTWYLNRISQS